MPAADPISAPAPLDPAGSGEMQMPAYVVKGYRPPEPQISLAEKLRIKIFLDLTMDLGWPGSSGQSFVISAIRVPQRIGFSPASVEVLPGGPAQSRGIKLTALNRAPLSSGPFATRGTPYLALFDGIPLRDPFTGSVNAGEIPLLGIGRVELVSGAGATAWGNWAESGVVHYFTEPAVGRVRRVPTETIGGGPIKPKLTKQLVERNGAVQVDLGSLGSMSAAVLANEPTTWGNWQLLAHYSEERESSPIGSAQRGPVDQQAWRKGRLVQARWRQPAGRDQELSLTWRSFHEERNEGTALQSGETDRNTLAFVFSSARVLGFAWQASGFVQWTELASERGAVDYFRTTETPLLQVAANDSTGAGGAVVGAWRPSGNSRVVVGADIAAQELSGEQTFFPLAQHSVGSGKRTRLGLFALGDFEIVESLHAAGGVRWDVPWEHDNQLNQTGLSGHPPITPIADRLTPSLGFSWNAAKRFTFRAQVQNGFREPTFGERYFQQAYRATMTNPNSLLKTETAAMWQAGVEYNLAGKYRFGAVASRSLRRQPIAALATVSATPDVFTRQLTNLNRIESDALGLCAVWLPSTSLEAQATITFTKAEAEHDLAYQGLEPAQTPSRSAQVAVDWQPVAKLRFGFVLDYVGARFADYENLLPLKSAAVLSLKGAYDLSERTELTASVRNISRVDLESDRGPYGSVYVAEPLKIAVGVKTRW